MKTILKITSLAAFAFIGTASFGQSLNINAGFTASTVKFDGMEEGTYTETYGGGTTTYSEEIKSIGGYNAAIGYEFRLGDRLSLETGFKYQTRGYRYVSEYTYENGVDNANGIEEYSIKYKYLDLPIVLNTAITTGDLRIYARTGISVGFMTGAKYSERSEYTSSDGDSELYEYSESYSGSDLGERFPGGLVLGAGAAYKGFYFETNYNLGALSLTNLDYGAFYHDLSLSLGYKFKFNK